MRHRTILLSLTFIALTGSAMAAVPDGSAPSDKAPLYHASPMINDPVTPTRIRGKAPDGSHIIGTPNTKPADPTDEYLQAQVPDPSKPPLYRASPMINDPVTGTIIRGKAPVSTAPPIHASPPSSDGGH